VFGDALGNRDQMNSEMHWPAVIERVWRCTWRPRSSGLRDTLGSHNGAYWEIRLEAMIDQDWRSIRRRSVWRLSF